MNMNLSTEFLQLPLSEHRCCLPALSAIWLKFKWEDTFIQKRNYFCDKRLAGTVMSLSALQFKAPSQDFTARLQSNSSQLKEHEALQSSGGQHPRHTTFWSLESILRVQSLQTGQSPSEFLWVQKLDGDMQMCHRTMRLLAAPPSMRQRS